MRETHGMDRAERLQFILQGKVKQVLWKLGMPTMLAMVVSGLYNVVDAFFVSHLGSSQMAAVAISFPISLIFIGICMTFGIGGASYVSRLLGEKHIKEANQVASTALYSGLLVTVVLAVFVVVFMDPLLQLLGTTAGMYNYAVEYLQVYLLALVLLAFSLIMNQLAGAEGLTKIPMISIILGSVLNIILNPLLIYGAGLGVSGSAWATVLAALGMDLYLMWFIFRRLGVLTYGPTGGRCSSSIYAEIFKIGIPMFVSQLLQGAVLGLANLVAAAYGDAAVAACGVINRILTLAFFVVYGFLRGYGPFVGINFGAEQFERVREATRTVLRWGLLYCFILSLFMWLLSEQIMGWFSNGDEEMLRIGAWMLWANGFGFLCFGMETVYMTIFVSIGYGKAGGLLNISLNGFFYIPLLLLLSHYFGLWGLVWSYSAAHVLNTLLTWVLKRHYLDRGVLKEVET